MPLNTCECSQRGCQYSTVMIGTPVLDGWAVAFGTAKIRDTLLLMNATIDVNQFEQVIIHVMY